MEPASGTQVAVKSRGNHFLKKVSAALREACLLAIEASRRAISSLSSAMRSLSSLTERSAKSCPISCVIFFLGRSSSSSFIANVPMPSLTCLHLHAFAYMPSLTCLRLRVLRLPLAQSESCQPWQHLVTEERELVQIVDKRDADPGHACIAQVGERLGDVVGIA